MFQVLVILQILGVLLQDMCGCALQKSVDDTQILERGCEERMFGNKLFGLIYEIIKLPRNTRVRCTYER